MKSTIKIFAIFAMVVGFAVGAKAQNTDTKTLEANATVLAGMKITKVSDLAFGSIAQGTSKTLSLSGTVSGDTKQGDVSVGNFKLEATKGSSLTYKLDTPENLVNGANNLPVIFTSEYGTSETYVAGTNTVQDADDSITMPTGGVIYFFVGGTINAGGTTPPPPGTYKANVTLTATYN
jgi:spore coat protein U-like protein